jgi:hypothetical protein
MSTLLGLMHTSQIKNLYLKNIVLKNLLQLSLNNERGWKIFIIKIRQKNYTAILLTKKEWLKLAFYKKF